MPKFLTSTPARLATIILLLQAVLLYSAVRPEIVPPSRPLSEMPLAFNSWQLAQEGVVEPEIMDALKADDLLNRSYRQAARQGTQQSDSQQASLFIAAFRTQRNGKTPHSPKNCLPGSGWTPLSSTLLPVDVGFDSPIFVNRYVIEHGDQRALVLYWYQSRDRVVASEYKAKFWVMADAIRLNRTDTALVRVIVPLAGRDLAHEQDAERAATDFVRSLYSTLLQFLPV